jgi:ABC-type phosphate/phosphonate transport system substrate-binding protein
VSRDCRCSGVLTPSQGGGLRNRQLATLRPALGLFVALGIASAQSEGSAQGTNTTAGGLRPTRLHAMVRNSMFAALHRNDAVAAIKSWFELTGKERGFALDSRVDVAYGAAAVERRLKEGSVDILILDVVDCLRLEGRGLVVPELVGHSSSGMGPRYSYVLLVGQSSSAKALSDLRGKSLHHFWRTGSNTGLAWLEVTMARGRLGRASYFFTTTKQAKQPQECVLPLFFGKVDACLREMNPQLETLQVVARATSLIECLIAMPVAPHPYRQELLDAILALHSSPRGRQLLMVFKTGRLVRIAPGDLDAARAVWTEYRALAGASPGSAAEPAANSGAGNLAMSPNERRMPEKE